MDYISITVLKSKEAAELLSCSYGHLMRMVRENIIPHYRIGTRVLFHKERLLEWINNGGTAGISKDKIC